MMRFFFLFLFLTCIVSLANAGTLTELRMSSDPGDYIGQGQSYYYPESSIEVRNSTWDRTNDGIPDYVNFSIRKYDYSTGYGDEWWGLTFSTSMLGVNLSPGFYDKAMRAPFEDEGHAGLDISGNGRGSNRLDGKFSIFDISFDYSYAEPRISSFAAEFEQHSEGAKPGLYGTFYYNSTEVVPEPSSLLLFFLGIFAFSFFNRKKG